MTSISTELPATGPVFAVLAQRLACNLGSGEEKLRTVQYLNLCTRCVQFSNKPVQFTTPNNDEEDEDLAVEAYKYERQEEDDILSISSLLDAIESSKSCELLCARTQARFTFAFNHFALAFWQLCTTADAPKYLLCEAERAKLLLGHFARIHQRFPDCSEQLEAAVFAPFKRLVNSDRLLKTLLLDVPTLPSLKAGDFVRVKQRIGIALPAQSLSKRARKEQNAEKDGGLSDDDDDVEALTLRKQQVKQVSVLFLDEYEACLEQVDAHRMCEVEPEAIAVNLRFLTLLSLALRSKSIEACAFVALLFSKQQQVSAADCDAIPALTLDLCFAQNFDWERDDEFILLACGVFIEFGNEFLAKELLARWIAQTGKWPTQHPDLLAALRLTSDFPKLQVDPGTQLDIKWRSFLDSFDFDVSAAGWRVARPDSSKKGTVLSASFSDSKLVVQWNGEKQSEERAMGRVTWILQDFSSARELFERGVDAFAALGKCADFVLRGARIRTNPLTTRAFVEPLTEAATSTAKAPPRKLDPAASSTRQRLMSTDLTSSTSTHPNNAAAAAATASAVTRTTSAPQPEVIEITDDESDLPPRAKVVEVDLTLDDE